MKLSVIIVSYNVKHFLEQCLHSVHSAITGIETEIYVVDNASVDGSVKMVKEKFPGVKCIANQDNQGFAKANNQAIRQSVGEYVLLLNPDTIVETDTFAKIIGFMDSHADAGGLGVKMVDGTGRFLPESKRGLPTPTVAFYKIFGLARLFPKSKTFNKYHLGYLDKDKTHQVEILAGAFMLVRKSVLDQVGLLDEAFFMYGEDIDLSYRIIKAGYHNYYYPETRIIHYKGESTKKGSLNYVFVFYNAMIIFAKKHFSAKNAQLFSVLINIAIYFRAFLSIISRVLNSTLLPLADGILLYAGLAAIARILEQRVIYPWGGHYPIELYLLVIPSFIAGWMISIYYSGGYDKPISIWKSYRGLAAGTIMILVIYALLPEHFRFSRSLILTGTVWGILALTVSRLLLSLLRVNGFSIQANKNKRFAVLGEEPEVQRVADLLQKALLNPGFIGLINTGAAQSEKNGYLGNITQINDIIAIYKIDELIFCAKDMPAENIIDQMSALQHTQLDFKIAPPESMSIIGSNSIDTAGDLYVIDVNSIGKFQNRRSKRVFDVVVCLILMASYPLTLFLTGNPFNYLRNIFGVLFGLKSITGYHPMDKQEHKLPDIRRGILYPTDALNKQITDDKTIDRLNIFYARDYRIGNEFRLLYKGFRHLGRKC
ncbi:MAG: glycosyltransferase [Bacteroidota bacterium]